MASMPPGGKACAQAGHAANAAIHSARYKLSWVETAPISDNPNSVCHMLSEWENQTRQGFGTSIVLGASEAQMRQIVATARDLDIHAAVVHDPSYPLQDGATLHLIPLDTCAYVFARKDTAKPLLNGLDLLP